MQINFYKTDDVVPAHGATIYFVIKYASGRIALQKGIVNYKYWEFDKDGKFTWDIYDFPLPKKTKTGHDVVEVISVEGVDESVSIMRVMPKEMEKEFIIPYKIDFWNFAESVETSLT
jgi:hypothetical protein